MRLVLLLALVSTASAQTEALAPRWTSAPTDSVRWEIVADTLGRRVYLDVETLESARVVDVWTWHAYAQAQRPPRGAVYDRVVALDRVFCGHRMTAPLHVARYLGRTGVGSFMYPPDVGPYGWAPGSVPEAVGERVCAQRLVSEQ